MREVNVDKQTKRSPRHLSYIFSGMPVIVKLNKSVQAEGGGNGGLSAAAFMSGLNVAGSRLGLT